MHRPASSPPPLAALCTGLLLGALPACSRPAPDRVAAPSLRASPSPAPRPSPTPSPPDSPAALAGDLTVVEGAIDSPATPAAELSALGRREQADYRLLIAHPEWQAAVLGAVSAPVHAAVVANVVAGSDLQTLTGTVAGPPPHWRILAPPPADVLLGYYTEAQSRYGIPWGYLAAIHLVETRMGRVGGGSSAGAQGPMQFIPSTWAEYGEGDIHDPHAAILAAARFLRAHGAPADMSGALHAYNPSALYVDAVTRYAERMLGDERAFLAYYAWQVYITTPQGDVLLPEGYGG